MIHIDNLIAAANRVLDGEVDIQRGNVAGAWPDDIYALAKALGREAELREFEPWQDDES